MSRSPNVSSCLSWECCDTIECVSIRRHHVTTVHVHTSHWARLVRSEQPETECVCHTTWITGIHSLLNLTWILSERPVDMPMCSNMRRVRAGTLAEREKAVVETVHSHSRAYLDEYVLWH
jgi:hypothetical protein